MESLACDHLRDSRRMHAFVRERSPEGGCFLLDEAQHVEHRERPSASLLSEGAAECVVTGSNASVLESEPRTPPTGRYDMVPVHAPSLTEFRAFVPDAHGGRPLPDDAALLARYLRVRGFPALRRLPGDDAIYSCLASLLDSILLPDVAQRHGIRDADALRRVLAFVMDNVGNLTAARRVSGRSGKPAGPAGTEDVERSTRPERSEGHAPSLTALRARPMLRGMARSQEQSSLPVPTAASYRVREKPFYLPIRDEVEVFERAFAEQIPLLLKGPTGCGKTRFVEYMAFALGQRAQAARDPAGGVGCLYTVACHEDLTARDLTGRYIMKGGEAVWVDGPATMAVRQGAILYLDEVVEARKDVIVVLHPLTDYRRVLPLELLGTELRAPESFMMVVSYNPGYQSVRKNLKQSTKQRFIALDFSYPPPEKERVIVERESGVDPRTAASLVLLGNDVRNVSTVDLEEGVSTRSLIHAAKMIRRGIPAKRACSIAIAQAITDEKDEIAAIEIIVDKIFRE